MKKFLLILLLVFNYNAYAQYKTDVLVLGGSASGASAALQAARSGVDCILVDEKSFLIGDVAPNMSIAAFNLGIWKEWKDSCAIDIKAKQLDPRQTLENIVNKQKKLQYFKETQVIKLEQNKKNWEVTIKRNGKQEKIKAKVLVDASFDSKLSPILNAGIEILKDGHIEAISSYTPAIKQNPCSVLGRSNLYRTSAAAGYGKDSVLHFLPIGAFISKNKNNLLFANNYASLVGFKSDVFNNIALWINIGQMLGAAAAYGPFFDVNTAEANVRTIQSEIIGYKGLIYPVIDVSVTDKSWYPIQKIIATQFLKFDCVSGKFNPNEEVLEEDIKGILSEVYPRSRIWFLENKSEKISLKQLISLLSFVGGKEVYDIESELAADWKNKYGFKSVFDENKSVTKLELAVLFDRYLSPFGVKVTMQGNFLK